MASYPALDLRLADDERRGETEDLLYAALDAHAPLAIHEQDTGGWRVFFASAARRDSAFDALGHDLPARLVALERVEVEDEDWARRSQAALTAVRAGRIIVAPPWDRLASAAATPGTLVIVIEPSTGFGTGHHATTRLCLELLQQVPVAGCRVVDAGTGSGLLAIAAWKLGAAAVVAVDCDPDALENARANVERNGANGSVTLLEADLAAPGVVQRIGPRPAQVLLANLTAGVLERHAGVLGQCVEPGGAVIVSGFSPDDLPSIAAAFGRPVAARAGDADWCAARLGSVVGPPGLAACELS